MLALRQFGTSRAFSALVSTLLWAVAPIAEPQAATLTGVVVALSDGDTLTILDDAHQQHRVRLAGIDAPERRQPYGNRSKQALATLTFRKQVSVEWHKRDRYGRVVGELKVGASDAGLELVRSGLAWHYLAYAREQSASRRDAYAEAERGARAAHIGLWQELHPEPPWEFRHRSRSATREQ